MSNDPPPPYPGGPSAPLIEEKHGPPSAPGTGSVPLLRGDIAKQTGPKEVWVPWDCPGCGLSSPHTGKGGAVPGSICPHVTLGGGRRGPRGNDKSRKHS